MPCTPFAAVWNWLRYANIQQREIQPGAEFLLSMTEQNVVTQLNNLRSHPAVANRLLEGDLSLHGWVYHIGHGVVTAYNGKSEKFEAPA